MPALTASFVAIRAAVDDPARPVAARRNEAVAIGETVAVTGMLEHAVTDGDERANVEYRIRDRDRDTAVRQRERTLETDAGFGARCED